MAGKSQQGTRKSGTAGFDRAVRELNAFLLVLAIGLAVLDTTCFVAFKVRDSLPSAALVNAGGGTAMSSARNNQSPATLTPSRHGAAAAGW
jgi:hypothetical protein